MNWKITDTEWRDWVRQNGHNYTLDELISKYPRVNKITMKCFCYREGVLYKKVRHTKAVARRREKIENGYFDVRERNHWLI